MKNQALLVIDVQHLFMKHGADAIVPGVATLTQRWPKDDLYYLAYRNLPDSPFTKHLDWHDGITSKQANIVESVLVPDARIWLHYGYAPPYELIDELKRYDSVAICGVDTDACVMAACFALWDASIRPVLLADYCASSGGKMFHKAALDLMMRQFGASGVLRGRATIPSDGQHGR